MSAVHSLMKSQKSYTEFGSADSNSAIRPGHRYHNNSAMVHGLRLPVVCKPGCGLADG